MTEIFLSYSRKDHVSLSRFQKALAALGYSVFSDQKIEPGTDWDKSIRQNLNNAKCALILWSQNSVVSDYVRHEAEIAKQQNKLIPVMIEKLAPDKLPIGFFTVQAADLSGWDGNRTNPAWTELLAKIQRKVMPSQTQVLNERKDAEVSGEHNTNVEEQDLKYNAIICGIIVSLGVSVGIVGMVSLKNSYEAIIISLIGLLVSASGLFGVFYFMCTLQRLKSRSSGNLHPGTAIESSSASKEANGN